MKDFLYNLRGAYHTITLCACWSMPRWAVSIRPTCFEAGPFQISLQNNALISEMNLALWRKRQGETMEERLRGAADFALMSEYSSEDAKDAARLILDRMNHGP